MYPLQINIGLPGKSKLLKRADPKKDLKSSKTSDFPCAWKNYCNLLFWNWISLKNTLKTKQNWQSSDWLRFIFCSQQSVFAPLPWKRRIIYSWAASHLPSLFLTKQQRKYWVKRLPAHIIWQIVSLFQKVYTNHDKDVYLKIFFWARRAKNSWTLNKQPSCFYLQGGPEVLKKIGNSVVHVCSKHTVNILYIRIRRHSDEKKLYKKSSRSNDPEGISRGRRCSKCTQGQVFCVQASRDGRWQNFPLDFTL